MVKMSRRGFLQGSSATVVAAHPLAALAKSGKEHMLFVGTQTEEESKGIYAYSFDSAAGELKQVGLAVEAQMPTFLALSPNRKMLFAANELDRYEDKRSGAISSYTIDRKAAKLTKVNEVATGGGGTCHVSVDHTGRCVFAANYGGGSATSFTVDATGKISDAVSFFQYTGSGPKPQQKGPRGHRVTVSPDNKYLFVNDLGLDEIHVYHLDAATAKLTPQDPPAWKADPGSGPRALLFHPNKKWAYCANEVGSTVNALNWDATKGKFTTLQLISTVPEDHQGPSAPSDLVMDKAGRFLYVANRLDDFMVSFAISPTDGKLTLMERTSCGGKTPRHIALDPTGKWLLVANQASDNLSVFARDAKTGKLANEGKNFPLSRPQCIVFY
ncbi:MAG: lactonase family protein [Edaphobacter sp.]|uniref:lactonase family protein n=1 Tax=Edaphobacter sp. TaxID=1934404 RepID=UPI0023A7156B|nr:lactonase family protein [Edaphobacter sp.]MDE1177284.1 lactonase family protein [Edaphobacter sp.]